MKDSDIPVGARVLKLIDQGRNNQIVCIVGDSDIGWPEFTVFASKVVLEFVDLCGKCTGIDR